MNIVLTVKRVDGVAEGPYSAVFDTANISGLRAVGSDTMFFTSSWGKKSSPVQIVVEEDFTTVQGLISLSTSTSGSTNKGVWGLIDTTGVLTGTSVGAHNLVDPVTNQPVVLPKGAIIKGGMILNKTTFDSATHTATIALGTSIDSATNLKAAVIVSNAQWIGANTKTALVPVQTVATFVAPLTTQQNLIYTVASEALTVGKALVYLEYTIDPLA